jgi:hypothetical protein
VLLKDAGVLHRHEPATKRNDAGAESDVLIMERCRLIRGLAHAAKLDFVT